MQRLTVIALRRSPAPADSVSHAALPVREKLYTDVPEYVFALYRQVADSMLPTQREAYVASVFSSVPALDGKPPGDPQVNFQEYGCCFLEDIIACITLLGRYHCVWL